MFPSNIVIFSATYVVPDHFKILHSGSLKSLDLVEAPNGKMIPDSFTEFSKDSAIEFRKGDHLIVVKGDSYVMYEAI